MRRILTCVMAIAIVAITFVSGYSASTMSFDDFLTAAEQGDLDKVKAALAQGMDVNRKHSGSGFSFGAQEYTKGGYSTNHDGWSALTAAASEGHLSIVEYLVSKGAEVDAKDDIGATPLMYAIWGGHPDVVDYLLRHNAEPKESKYGMTGLMMAAYEPKCADVLIAAGSDVNAQDNDGMSVAMYFRKNTQLLQNLIQHGVNLNVQDKNGNTAFIYAIEDGVPETVEFLLIHGADPSLKNNEGLSAIDIARKNLADANKNILKVKKIDAKTDLVTEGFLYQKDMHSRPRVLTVKNAVGGILQIEGEVEFGFGGGGFDSSPQYAVGVKWVFPNANVTFKNGAYMYTSKFNGATVEFRDDGVLLKGFSYRNDALGRFNKIVSLLQEKIRGS